MGIDEYKIGVWARDDTQGIGTLTFVTTDGKYGALGHGISDVDTGNLLDSNEGILYLANIWGIRKGVDGTPGGLCGSIDYEESKELGTIKKNTNQGIYGSIIPEKINELLKLTNGIIQGMSGSPIIQDGKLIGTLSHVSLKNPKEGYACYAKFMYDTLNNYA